MISDTFELHTLGSTRVLRICNKVDFAPEVVWSRAFNANKPEAGEKAAELITAYLRDGFDSVDGWTGDEEAWHQPVLQHMGFTVYLDSRNLIPVLSDAARVQNDAFLTLLREKLAALKGQKIILPTGVGETADFLNGNGEAFSVTCRTATVEVDLNALWRDAKRELRDAISDFVRLP
jgi:hypothetical protein